MSTPRRLLRAASRRVRGIANAVKLDAVLASYPKSGRTWLRFILANYFAMAAGKEEGVDLHGLFTVVPNFDSDPVRGIPAFRFANAAPRVPLVAVTHDAYSRFLFWRRPIVYLVRDPRDVMVSAYFHQTRHKNRFAGGIPDFLADPEFGIASYARHVNGWARGLTRHRHIVVSYERLSAGTKAEMTKILRFLGCEADEAVLGRAIEIARFDSMREMELSKGMPAHTYDRGDSESSRMRKGKVGGFSDYLSPQEVEAMLAACAGSLTPAAKSLLQMPDFG
ncbi:MAG: sulfotransferase domain-containing protein [Aestuariivirga sp.]